MSRIYCVAVVVLLSCSVALSQTDLINDSLNGSPPGSWTKVGSGPNARLDNDHGTGGDWAIGGSDGSGSSAAYDLYYSRTFNTGDLPGGAGPYSVDLEGWVKAWAGWWSGENFNWLQQARLELWIDGSMVFSGNAGQCESLSPWDTWVQRIHSGTHTINSSIEVRMRARKGNSNCGADALGAIFYDSRFDAIKLTVTSMDVTDWNLY